MDFMTEMTDDLKNSQPYESKFTWHHTNIKLYDFVVLCVCVCVSTTVYNVVAIFVWSCETLQ